MDAVPALPPYAHITQEAVQCAAQASSRYEVPELLLHAILMKENGRMGQCVTNRNGTRDCGYAQINTSWLNQFARYGIKLEHIVNDTCTNLNASAYILRDNFNKKDRDWFAAIVSYNIGPNRWTDERYRIGFRYASDVVRYWWGFQNWVDAQNGVRRAQPSIPAPSALSRAPGARAAAPRTQPAPRPAIESSPHDSLAQSPRKNEPSAAFSGSGRPHVFEAPG